MIPKSKILIIAGSDSSGGAGIQADIKTVTALGSYAMTAITAVTIQNTTGVKSIVSIDPKKISDQIEFTSKDIKPDAIKIGMLHSTEVIKSNERTTDFITPVECNIPIFMASGLISFEVNSIWSEIFFGSIDTIDLTPVVFWVVTAVIAVIAYEPNAVTVLISAWMPAPPDESDPAMINILEFGFNLFNLF